MVVTFRVCILCADNNKWIRAAAKNQILNVNSFLIYNLRQCRSLQSSGDGSSTAGGIVGCGMPQDGFDMPLWRVFRGWIGVLECFCLLFNRGIIPHIHTFQSPFIMCWEYVYIIILVMFSLLMFYGFNVYVCVYNCILYAAHVA